jgi:hypothetical protein
MKIQRHSFHAFRHANGPRKLICAAFLAAFSCTAVIAQQTTPAPATPAPPAATPAPASQPSDTPASTAANQKPQDPAMVQRKKQLAADTAKLLELANELKTEMDKSSKDTLSLNVIKKADQVEKLAHKVRDEMKATIGN